MGGQIGDRESMMELISKLRRAVNYGQPHPVLLQTFIRVKNGVQA
jgi:hypothetical protein